MKPGTKDPLKKKTESSQSIIPGLEPKQKSNSSRRTVYMDDDLWKRLKYFSFNNETSVSKILELAGKEFLTKYENITS